jgi:nucleotide-binding universal stress UspA family protein
VESAAARWVLADDVARDYCQPKLIIQFGKIELIKRILVPTDRSPVSLDAIDYALDLAIPDQTEILITFVIEPIQRAFPPPLIKRQRKAAAEKLDRMAAKVMKRHPKCRTEVHFGVPYQVIVGLAEKQRPT